MQRSWDVKVNASYSLRPAREPLSDQWVKQINEEEIPRRYKRRQMESIAFLK
jgi:hypothetical protein